MKMIFGFKDCFGWELAMFTYFKSLYSHEHGREPPPTAGATTRISYLMDMIERKNTPRKQ
jgi:hypothetical protein